MPDVILFIFLVLLAYIVGSIPSGFLVAKMRGVQDIRKLGSGNIGATNVARTLGIKFFFLIFFLDFFKAFSFLYLLHMFGFSQQNLIACALAIFLGNGFSLFLGFKGGKGVATSFGIVLALQPSLLIFLFIVWAIVFVYTKTVGVASIVVLAVMPFFSLYFLRSNFLLFSLMLCIAILGLFFHRNNIKKLYNKHLEKM